MAWSRWVRLRRAMFSAGWGWDVLAGAGAALVIYGVSRIYVPAAWILAGLALALVAAVGAGGKGDGASAS